jgi:hypothetical protein
MKSIYLFLCHANMLYRHTIITKLFVQLAWYEQQKTDRKRQYSTFLLTPFFKKV